MHLAICIEQRRVGVWVGGCAKLAEIVLASLACFRSLVCVYLDRLLQPECTYHMQCTYGSLASRQWHWVPDGGGSCALVLHCSCWSSLRAVHRYTTSSAYQ
jgi:hypothetical protein